MKVFAAQVVDNNGRKSVITEQAISRPLFEESLSGRGFFIVDIKESVIRQSVFTKKKLSGKFILDFTYNIYSLLDFGIDINEVFKIMSEIYKEGIEGEFIRDVISFLNKGEKLSAAIRNSMYGEVFDDFFITMVSSGEQSGKLKDAFSLIYSYTKNKKQMREKIISVTIYPLILLTVSIIILNIMNFLFIPMIKDIYSNMDYEPKNFIRFIFTVSDFIRTNYVLYFLFLFLVITALVIYFKTKASKKLINYFLINTPVISRVAKLQTKIKTSFSLEILLKGGYSLEESLVELGNIENNESTRDKYLNSVSILKSGGSVRNAFKSLDFFDDRDLNIIEISDSISKSPDGFNKIHSDAGYQLEVYLEKLFTMLNPAVLIIVGLMVFIIMYLVVSPTIGTLDNIKNIY